MTYLELHKAFNGNKVASQSVNSIKADDENCDLNDWYIADYFESSGNSGAGAFGCIDLVGNNYEPYISLASNTFGPSNGNGTVNTDIDFISWPLEDVFWGEPLPHPSQISPQSDIQLCSSDCHHSFCESLFRYQRKNRNESFGFRLCRSAE
jgi:hypothetical protein